MCNSRTYGETALLLQLGRLRHDRLLQYPVYVFLYDPWANLQTFDFVLRRPLRNHVTKVLDDLYHCALIVTFRTQLATHADRAMWKDPAIASIHADLWMEFKEGYSIILDFAQKTGNEKFLKSFTILDSDTPGKGIIDDPLERRPLVGWYTHMEGCWEKETSDDQQ